MVWGSASSSSGQPDLSTTVAGISLDCCIYNASGPRSGTSAALVKVASSAAGAVLTKSATLEDQSGNPQPRTWHHPTGLCSLNSEGLPNQGIDYYIDETTIQESLAAGGGKTKINKPYIVSLSGKTLEDNLVMLERIAASPTRKQIAALELNLACPNVIGKPIIAYDFMEMSRIFRTLHQHAAFQLGKLPPIGVKLAPYLDMPHFEEAASAINKFKHLVKYVVTTNTVGNALAVDVDACMPTICSNSGYAGMSGPAVHATALANVRRLRKLLDPDVDIVGVGGVCTGEEAAAMILCGASAVQVATTHWKEGPGCFDRIAGELRAYMSAKGYKSIADFKGKLQHWSKQGAALARANRQKLGAAATATASQTFVPKTKYKATSATSSSGGGGSGGATFYKLLCAILIVIVAILAADKWTDIEQREVWMAQGKDILAAITDQEMWTALLDRLKDKEMWMDHFNRVMAVVNGTSTRPINNESSGQD